MKGFDSETGKEWWEKIAICFHLKMHWSYVWPMHNNKLLFYILLSQLPILASSVVSLYFLELTDVFKPVHSGFSCYDRSLSMPYIEPTQEAIPFLMLLSLAFAGPAITVRIAPKLCLSVPKIKNGHICVINVLKINKRWTLNLGTERSCLWHILKISWDLVVENYWHSKL